MSAPRHQLAAFFLGALIAVPAIAENAGTSGELGRLFFTPERRQQLDRQRELKIEETREPESEPALTINGVVVRSSGKRTVWINNVAHDDAAAANGVAVSSSRAAPGSVVVRPPDTAPIRASVGDTVNRNSGEAAGLLGSGHIATRPDGAR